VSAFAGDVVGSEAGGRFWRTLTESVSRAVVGQSDSLRLLATALLAQGHCLIEDVPGVGKTLLARAFAKALDLQFGRLQGTPDLLPSDITGTNVLDGGQFRFVPGPVFTNVLLADEVNRATPRAQSALLEAMQERQVTVDAVTRPLPSPFMVVATQNPIELEGTFSLPEAQLDRFLLRATLGYPDDAAERAIAARYDDAAEPLEAVTTAIGAHAIGDLIGAARAVHVSAEVEAFLVAIVRATRVHPAVSLGGSPRASVSLHRACQAWALLAGRRFVLPDDVLALARPVLSHRIQLDVDRQLRGTSVEDVLSEVLADVPVPPVTRNPG
jgi:MoxR-like ATPase